MGNYFEYIHLDSSIDTIDKLLSDEISIVKGINKNEFLQYSFDGIIRNIDQIWFSYSEKQKEENESKYKIGNLDVLNTGTLLYIPNQNLNNETAIILGYNLFAKHQNPKLFMSEELQRIQNDPNYKKSNSIKVEGDKYSINTFFNELQVWCYCRAINKLIDVTPFIISVDTNLNVNGGDFLIKFSPFSDIYNNIYTQKDVINNNSIDYKKSLNESWVIKNIQMNDFFFIKFEKLASEKRINKFYIDKTELPGQIFDMIGLADVPAFDYNPAINEMNVNVRGRDVMKLLQIDGSYFHPFAFIEGAEERFFIKPDVDNRYFKRLFISGQFKTIFTMSFKSIRTALGFIFNQLTNTGVCSENDLFSAYGDRRSQVYEVQGTEQKELKKIQQNGIYQIVDLIVDNKLDNRRIANDGISNPDGTLIEQVFKICQEPFVEFWGDTYGDKYVFTARQPPFTRSQIIDYIDNQLVVEISGENVSNVSLDFSTEFYTLYQLKPENSFLGKSDYVHMAYFPAILIPRYMDVFGNSRKILSSNYISYEALSGSGENSNVNLFREAAVNDLIYLIESTIYLPFTRKGVITVKGGDRRIKRGNWIYFKPTDEYFYVLSVGNSARIGRYDLDRETVITVERGMKRKYVKGEQINLDDFVSSGKDVSVDNKKPNEPGDDFSYMKPTNSVLTDSFFNYVDGGNNPSRFNKRQFAVSYFNIIDIEYIKNKLINFSNEDNKTGFIKSYINDDVMNFFMYKLQFEND